MTGKMCSAQWLGCIMLLMLALHGNTVNAHGKHGAKVKQVLPDGVLPLEPSCVPKYVTELLLPPPMPVNSAPNTLPAGRCSYAFEHPPHCSPDYPHREGGYHPNTNPCSDPYPDEDAYSGYDHRYADHNNAYPDHDGGYPGYAELQAGRVHRTLLAEGVAQPAASAEAQQAIEPAAALKYKTKDKHVGEYRKPVHHEGSGEHYTKGHEKHSFKRYDEPERHHDGPGPYDHPDHEHYGGPYHNQPYYDRPSHDGPGPYNQRYYRSHDWNGYDDGKEWVNPGPRARHDPAYDSYGDQPSYPDPHHHTPSECDTNGFREYQISVKQIDQKDVFPANVSDVDVDGVPLTCTALPTSTPVFAYGPTNGPLDSYNWPALTIESRRYQPNRIRWANELVNSDGTYRPHLFPSAVDQTLHWANPERLGGTMIDESPCMKCSADGTDCEGACTEAAEAESYNGPVPIVTHVHGMEDVRDYSDGYPEAWFLPKATDTGTASKVGTWYETFKRQYEKDTHQTYTGEGSATYIYPNTQRPSAAWYHDHTVGITRLNVYAGLAGFNFVRKFFPLTRPELPGIPFPPPAGHHQVPSTIRELPLAIQDRLFLNNGSLWYPENNATIEPERYLPNAQGIPPKWLAEFPLSTEEFPQIMMTVNGRVWPQRTLDPDTYRLRLLNGCNSRTLKINFAKGLTNSTNGGSNGNTTDFDYALTDTYSNLQFWVIGNEAGFFPQIQGPFTNLTMGPAERLDVIIDLSEMKTNEYVWMYNTGPDGVYTGDTTDGTASLYTSQLLRFQFRSPTSSRTSFNPARRALLDKALIKEAPQPLPDNNRPVRQLALIEENGPAGVGVKAVLLGSVIGGLNAPPGQGSTELWADPVAIGTPCDTVEDWDIINLTPDAHPMHLHEVNFETIRRTRIHVVANTADPTLFEDVNEHVTSTDLDPLLQLSCPPCVLGSRNSLTCPALRDVTLMLPHTRTRIRLRTGKKPGVFVWHCHLLEHEDNEMMRPWCVGQPGYKDPKSMFMSATPSPFCPSDT